jgi:hypothetical protein
MQSSLQFNVGPCSEVPHWIQHATENQWRFEHFANPLPAIARIGFILLFCALACCGVMISSIRAAA